MTSQNEIADVSLKVDHDDPIDTDIAVIGAGIAGLVCAEQLRQAGYGVVVIEKSRGFGGRAATKRLPNFRADHGIRYLARSGRLLPVLIDTLHDRDLLQPWNVRFCRVTPEGTIQPETLRSTELDSTGVKRYIAPAGANAIGKFLAQALTVWRSRRAIALSTEEDRWCIQLEAVADGVDAPLSLTARAIVVAVPAPQAAELIATTETIAPEIKTAIAAVSYHPVLA
ncbi:MAG: FAD-dependent oxidoreductase [Coleofasciculaceae cyanobacterium RL_1_1]|nr:FAD-dependent oxidoreductase [Coleofasciculaceae cyanobacterium RL_1_1]